MKPEQSARLTVDLTAVSRAAKELHGPRRFGQLADDHAVPSTAQNVAKDTPLRQLLFHKVWCMNIHSQSAARPLLLEAQVVGEELPTPEAKENNV